MDFLPPGRYTPKSWIKRFEELQGGREGVSILPCSFDFPLVVLPLFILCSNRIKMPVYAYPYTVTNENKRRDQGILLRGICYKCHKRLRTFFTLLFFCRIFLELIYFFPYFFFCVWCKETQFFLDLRRLFFMLLPDTLQFVFKSLRSTLRVINIDISGFSLPTGDNKNSLFSPTAKVSFQNMIYLVPDFLLLDNLISELVCDFS